MSDASSPFHNVAYTATRPVNYQTIGTCSLCGGEVLAFTGPWFGTPPEPQCSSCGAYPARPERPVIPMEHRREFVHTRPIPKTTRTLSDLWRALAPFSDEPPTPG